MASEAQRLIGISLTKIAQSRAHRGGVSLHKNLLVATVLQKARYIFMEEAYNMVHYQAGQGAAAAALQARQRELEHHQNQQQLVGLTAEEALSRLPGGEDEASSGSGGECLQDFLQPACVRCSSEKENQPPYCASGELTYLDLDKGPASVLRDNGGGNHHNNNNTNTNSNNNNNNNNNNNGGTCLKRRRAVTEWETEEAVASILPKRCRAAAEEDDSVFLEDAAAALSDSISKELEAERLQEASSSAMEIDRITSLVSIFSFGISGTSGAADAGSAGSGKLNRSVSTPDLCSAQAKDAEAIQQRPFLAMTV